MITFDKIYVEAGVKLVILKEKKLVSPKAQSHYKMFEKNSN
jgi:hypothetical protein